MTDYNEEIDEFAPVQMDITAPAANEPEQPEIITYTESEQVAAQAQPNAYDSIIAQQTEQINALIAQNESLTNQLTQLIKNGAQIGNRQQYVQDPIANLNGVALSDNDDWSLESLAKDIGKKPRH